jgi:hypothetical protein
MEQMKALDDHFAHLSTSDEAMRQELSRESQELQRAQASSRGRVCHYVPISTERVQKCIRS